jgi:tetratricopeptide (TPR) repeat protein
MELAQRAIDIDPVDPLGYQILGNLYFVKGNFAKGIELREKALELAPNSFNVIAGLAGWLWRVGEAERALELLEHGKRISPRYPWWIMNTEAVSLQLVGKPDRAVEVMTETVGLKPKRADMRAYLAAALVDAGRLDEAKQAVGDALNLDPMMNIAKMRRIVNFQAPETTEWYIDLLRTAGMPD